VKGEEHANRALYSSYSTTAALTATVQSTHFTIHGAARYFAHVCQHICIITDSNSKCSDEIRLSSSDAS